MNLYVFCGWNYKDYWRNIESCGWADCKQLSKAKKCAIVESGGVRMLATAAYVTGDTVTIRDEKLKVFDGHQIIVNIFLPEQKKNAAERFFEVANKVHGNSMGQKWTREELHER